MKSKKIVWVAHESNVSGANLCLREFMQISAEAGFDQILILPHGGNMESIAKELNIPVRVIPFNSWVIDKNSNFLRVLSLKKLLRNALAIIEIAYVLFKNRPDLVFTNTSVISVGAWASLLTRTNHYWYVHEMGEEDFGFKLPWGELSYRFMNFASNKVLTNSYHLADKYKKKYNKIDIEVLRYAVFVEKVSDCLVWLESNPIKLLLLGQVSEAKGHLLALQAISELKKGGYNVNLSIVGKCENLHFLKKLNHQISLLDIKDCVNIKEYTNNPVDEIISHHILLMCSRCEAFGRVTVEAMKVCVPVIGSDTCGTKEILDHGVTGYLFQQGNYFALTLGIKKLIDDVNFRSNIMKEAKVSAEALANQNHFMNFLKHIK